MKSRSSDGSRAIAESPKRPSSCVAQPGQVRRVTSRASPQDGHSEGSLADIELIRRLMCSNLYFVHPILNFSESRLNLVYPTGQTGASAAIGSLGARASSGDRGALAARRRLQQRA